MRREAAAKIALTPHFLGGSPSGRRTRNLPRNTKENLWTRAKDLTILRQRLRKRSTVLPRRPGRGVIWPPY